MYIRMYSYEYVFRRVLAVMVRGDTSSGGWGGWRLEEVEVRCISFNLIWLSMLRDEYVNRPG